MIDYHQLANDIKTWGSELGFQQVRITDTDLSLQEQHLQQWLAKGWHGDMHYMSEHGTKRSRPEELVPDTKRIISVRMDYLPANANMIQTLARPKKAYISRYALGRDYHKVLRQQLKKLAQKIEHVAEHVNYRVFVDTAPAMEVALAEKAGLGWRGKHNLIINRQAGSWFFLGELYTNLPLPIDKPTTQHCGSCQSCIKVCPTNAIKAPYQLDARRCISYLTIEYKGIISEELRPLMGNRIYGCDDCQIICPWNRFAKPTKEKQFQPRHQLTSVDLISLFNWSETDFLTKTEGMSIRRIGYHCWLRNIAIALGNAPQDKSILSALQEKQHHPSELVRTHVQWAIMQQHKGTNNGIINRS